VSAAHAGDLTLAVAGPHPLGCDVEPAVARPSAAWRDLLGLERFALAEIVAQRMGEDADAAATRVWAACECLKKAGAMLDAPLVLADTSADGWVVLSSGALRVAAWVASVPRSESRLALAVLVRSDNARV
jgi:enediyne polyketide synthase